MKTDYRNPSPELLSRACFVVCSVLFVVGLATGKGGLIVSTGFLAVFGAWGGWWVVVRTDDDGVLVRNVRSRRLLWSDVTDVSLRPRWGVPQLVIALGSRSIPCQAVTVNFRTHAGLDYCRDAERKIRATWHRAGGTQR